jgi:hypothetical protein
MRLSVSTLDNYSHLSWVLQFATVDVTTGFWWFKKTTPCAVTNTGVGWFWDETGAYCSFYNFGSPTVAELARAYAVKNNITDMKHLP